MTDPLHNWPAFMSAVRARLEAGRVEYGDRSFERDPGELLGEIEQELMDVAAWGFIAWTRINALRAMVDGQRTASTPCPGCFDGLPNHAPWCDQERP